MSWANEVSVGTTELRMHHLTVSKLRRVCWKL